MNLFCRLTETNFPRRDQSQTLIEVKPCHARKLKISAESRQRGLSRICLPFITALIAFSLARVRSISAVHNWAFRLILVYANSGFRAGRRLDYMDFVLSHMRCSDSYI